MAATKRQIEQWFLEGKKNGYDRMIILCDTYDYTDFPDFYYDSNYHMFRLKEMEKVMEVYDLNGDIEHQLNLYRAYFPPNK